MKAMNIIGCIALIIGATATACRNQPREATIEPLAIVRELHCFEDEDIVITLGQNGLPFGYCEQVIER